MAKANLDRNPKGQFVAGNDGGGSVARARVTRDKVIRALKRNSMTEADWLDRMIRHSGQDKSAKDFINRTLFPTYKAEQQPIKFNMQGETLVEKAENILAEVAKGKLSVENGVQLLRALKELGSLIEFEELASKIEQLEAQITEGFNKLADTEENEDDWD
jgi:hypothetical protein